MDKLKEKLKKIWSEFWLFATSFFFLKNFAAMISVLVFFFVMTNLWLKCYTRHGESVVLENFEGKTLSEAKELAKKHDFRFEVIDSVWYANKKPGVITNQEPKANSPVKKYRTVYLTISKFKAEEVSLPLFGESSYNYSSYSRKLGRKDIHTTIKDKIFDPRQANNSIVHFFYKGKKITDKDIKEGFKASKGDTLQFIVTERTSNSVSIPNLVCIPFSEAEFMLSGSRLSVGEISEDGTVTNRANAYVWKQMPAYRRNRIVQIGTQVDLYLTQEIPDGCQ
ncbi:MAG: PASTA domain-containing protein [Saprospiraceae bacterium]|jgi:D-alanine-D-alanine ligase|nr:PASTA domain-containing protein [Saprospiraceae bacterium]